MWTSSTLDILSYYNFISKEVLILKVSDKMKQNILSYKDEIKTISSFVDAVRETVGQYLGYNDTRGHLNMIREIAQNAFDEMVKVDSPCHEI